MTSIGTPKRNLSRHVAATLVAAGLLAFAGPLSAQDTAGPTIFTAPDDMCAWDWASPATPWLLAALKREDLLEHSVVDMAKTCPEKLCDVRWGGYAIPDDFPDNGGLVQEFLCQLALRQVFFEVDIIAEITPICPDVAAQMVELAPAAGEACPPFTPGVSLGGPTGGPVEDDDVRPDDDSDDDDGDTAPPFDFAPDTDVN